MATPTPMKHALSQQGRTPSQSQQLGAGATPPVSTPFSTHAYTAFSPLGPRSSPQQTKKSPANSATLMGHSASSAGIVGGGGSHSGHATSYDSPAAAAVGALGLGGGGGGGGLDLGLDHGTVGGLGPGRSDEDERTRRLQTVWEMLKSRGRVSEAGLERLAKSMQLECLWEEGMGGSKARTLIIAGRALALDIVLCNNLVESVSVTFPESSRIGLRHAARANTLLLADLALRPGESPLTKKLDAFAANLERLAVLDRLSVEPGLNLYEAVAGLYETLDRLYAWEVQELGGAAAAAAADVETTVQCTRHGRPTMHEHGRLGLGISYWKERRLVPPTQPGTRAHAAAHETVWTLLVGCAPMGTLVYQPVRVSDRWLSEAVVKPGRAAQDGEGGGGGEPILDWLEPDNTFLPAELGSGDGDDKHKALGDAAASGPRLPEVLFHAVLEPPVIVPLAVWHHIYELVGLAAAPDMHMTFDALTFPLPAGTQHDPSEPRTISCDKAVVVPPRPGGDGDGAVAAAPVEKTLRRTLFIYKPVYGRAMTEAPFAHPRQLLQLLPVLRQYAFLSTVLAKGFGAGMAEVLPPTATAAAGRGDKDSATLSLEEEFAAFMSGPAESQQQQPPRSFGAGVAASANRPVSFLDAVLTVHPLPRLQVVFPFRDRTADVLLEIGENAEVRVIAQNIFLPEAGGSTSTGSRRPWEAADLGRMLEVCEDVGLWSEWIRSRCG